MSITVLNPGLLTTVQDMGRVGYQQFGVSVSGVMDPRSAAIANILVGNPEDEAVLECTMMGPQLLFNQAETIAITGGDLMPTLDGQPMPTYRAVTVRRSGAAFPPPRRAAAALLPSPADWIPRGNGQPLYLHEGQDRRISGPQAPEGRRDRLPGSRCTQEPEYPLHEPRVYPPPGVHPAGGDGSSG